MPERKTENLKGAMLMVLSMAMDRLLKSALREEFESVSFDILSGLPLQTKPKFLATYEIVNNLLLKFLSLIIYLKLFSVE